MEVPLDWICPICRHRPIDAACDPCFKRLCYGCELWWAKKLSCVICRQQIRATQYSVRSDNDYIECPVLQPATHSMSLIKMLKCTSTKTDSWGTPYVIHLYLDLEPLTTALWLQPSNQFLTHQIVLLSNPYLSNLEIRMW